MTLPTTQTGPTGTASPHGDEAPRVVAVVLNWNGGEDTLACLRSLRAAQEHRPLPLLVDNGSDDGSVDAALAEDEHLLVLRHGENLGYAAGNNRAVEHAFSALAADWVMLVNSDLLAPPELLARLLDGVAEAERTGTPVGAAGPCLVYLDDPSRIWACGGRVGAGLNVTQLLDHGRLRMGEPGPPRDVDYVPGTCLLISRSGWEAAGSLDESFFCYLEDADWGLRLREAGLRGIVVPAAVAAHGLSASTGGGYSAGRKYMTAVNSVHFLRKHGSLAGWLGLLLFDILLWPVAFLRGLAHGHGAAALAKLKGVVDGLRGERVTASVAHRYARRPS